MSAASSLYRALHGGDVKPSLAKQITITAPKKVTGMGKLQWLEVCRDNGRVEQWHFEKNEPRICFGPLTDDDRGRSTLWILGGSYRVTSKGFRLVTKTTRLKRLDLARTSQESPAIVDRYKQTHGYRDPVEALLANLVVPDELVPIGNVFAVCYDADKGDGNYPYRHPFALTAQPLLCCDAGGSQLFVVGGRYTVTPHGIEDGR